MELAAADADVDADGPGLAVRASLASGRRYLPAPVCGREGLTRRSAVEGVG